MGREISLFSDYHQLENRLTNYCGLMLKLVYEESPTVLEEVLSTLLKDDAKAIVGPRFSQQEKASKSIPDLTISQKAFTIFVETKIGDWFYKDQIDRHKEGIKVHCGEKILILLSNAESDHSTKLGKAKKEAKKQGIKLIKVSLEELVNAIEENVKEFPKLTSIVSEFREFLDRQSLLPTWKYRLTVVNCGRSLYTFEDRYYDCPDTGKSYSHQRARFLGPYAMKKVDQIYEIQAVVALPMSAQGPDDVEMRYFNVRAGSNALDKKLELDYKKRAWALVQKDSELKKELTTQWGMQIFLLGDPCKTDFVKDSSGGMMGSKQYFQDIAHDCKTAEDLARKLNGKVWSKFKV